MLVTAFLSGEVIEQHLSQVRIEITKTADKYRTGEGTLWYDFVNSSPAGAAFLLPGEKSGGEIVRRQYVIYDGEEIDVTGVRKHNGDSAPHHYEIKLGGVIPYNG
jgi:hypothetical protein